MLLLLHLTFACKSTQKTAETQQAAKVDCDPASPATDKEKEKQTEKDASPKEGEKEKDKDAKPGNTDTKPPERKPGYQAIIDTILPCLEKLLVDQAGEVTYLCLVRHSLW